MAVLVHLVVMICFRKRSLIVWKRSLIVTKRSLIVRLHRRLSNSMEIVLALC